MNFFINKAMGIGNSGVEHAQFYRAECFDLVKLPYKYIFMELVKNLHEAMDNWNIEENQVINIWEFFVLGDSYLYEGITARVEAKSDLLVDFTNTHRVKETITSSGLLIREHFEKSTNKKNPKTLLVSNYKTEIYNAKTLEKKIMFELLEMPHRGRVMSNIHIYDFHGKHLFFRNEILFQRFFLHYLAEKFDGAHNFFIDRGEETEAAIFNHRPANSKIIELVHADHLSDRDVPEAPLWNNYYEYLLTHLDAVDKVVVATKLQRADLLVDFPNQADKFAAIPVGGIDDIDFENIEIIDKKNLVRFVTASRLASEKHLDIVIEAINKAHQKYPAIILDIYGQGGEDQRLREKIKALNAESFIQLKGHTNSINDVLLDYDVFISASFSEGFGLTYIEALNANLPIVTFNARFGAIELVKTGVNGIVKEFSRTDSEFNINSLAEGIDELIELDRKELLKNIRPSVKDFQKSVIANQWKELVNEL
ncbi:MULTISPECIES: glycosyltransferase [unclassified Enterococcus]|uniref:glycosyltransferase n=1 Tax=unclassified Enterococcus TaxID=2608891 RepID=UPI001553CA50|nr:MULTISPECIES: glycosyltransferase [unclassified Enterococcus]MBS7576337.1 glycosyltransferase [Enterococcus sp. MMGLQ5-2]MBS7583569.1 glycosyltransferase [Enterococcus sp. MMGLQ5-1]NPD11431.1 glycosyltransferase [Enterococcus sp. MMGLQ5-1]NPD36175.1 glycosyltransferase [Enterococcus sp. MMGLQ5-2]